MFCRECGTRNIDNSIFCESCGAKLVKPRSNRNAQGNAQHNRHRDRRPIKAEPKPNRAPLVIGLLLVLIIGTIALSFLLRGGSENIAYSSGQVEGQAETSVVADGADVGNEENDTHVTSEDQNQRQSGSQQNQYVGEMSRDALIESLIAGIQIEPGLEDVNLDHVRETLHSSPDIELRGIIPGTLTLTHSDTLMLDGRRTVLMHFTKINVAGIEQPVTVLLLRD